MLHRADRSGNVSHEIDLIGAADEVFVNRFADTIRVTNQYVDRAIQPINPCFRRYKAFLQVTLSLRFQRVLHFDFNIGADDNLLRGIHCSSPRWRVEPRSIHIC